MKLELNHIAPYLPYRLACDGYDGKTKCLTGELMRIETGVTLKHSEYDPYVIVADEELPLSEIKPLLRSMSQFTQEIRHNGKALIPAQEFFYEIYCAYDCMEGDFVKDYNPDADKTYYYGIHIAKGVSRWTFFITEYESGTTKEHAITSYEMSYWHFQMLFKWHFDVYGLIDAGLAIELPAKAEK